MPQIDGKMTPLDVLMRLPADQPAFVLHSGACAPPFARYSIIATPRAVFRFTDHSELVWLPSFDDGDVEQNLVRAARSFTNDPLENLERLLATTRESAGQETAPPFVSGWIGMLAYELGAVIEPTAKRRSAARSLDWPLIELGWCPEPMVFDHVTNEWVRGAEQVERLSLQPAAHESWRVGELQPDVSREQHIDNVARTIEHIRAGDIFQANITQHFNASFNGNTRAFARAALEASQAWYGAILELTDGRTLVSMSPELFFHADHHNESVITRPIKGTLPRKMDPSALEASAKDKAELAMIVDLMRNDLGRVCEPGTVRVPNPRTIETHGAVHQGVGEVTGRLPKDVTPSDLIRATFPPGSVTGAPKIRAMQIIDELEASPRGPYCGAIGFISDQGQTMFNVAIRTIALAGTHPTNRVDELAGALTYGAGGGIVVDSIPEAEYQEALDKTAMLRELMAKNT